MNLQEIKKNNIVEMIFVMKINIFFYTIKKNTIIY